MTKKPLSIQERLFALARIIKKRDEYASQALALLKAGKRREGKAMAKQAEAWEAKAQELASAGELNFRPGERR